MKNKLADLNNHLFAQIERLGDEALTPEQIEQEARRGQAIVAVADKIISMTALQIQAAKIMFDSGHEIDPPTHLPMLDNKPHINGKATKQ